MPWVSRLRNWFNATLCALSARRKAPLLPPQIVALLPDIPGGEPNLLPRSAWLAPLPVDIPMWPNSDPSVANPEYLRLYLDGPLVGEKTFTQPVMPADLIIMVPETGLVEGLHRLQYRVVTPNAEPADSSLLTMTVDKTAPTLENEGSLIFPPEVISGGVTEHYLKAHGDRLLAEVPLYTEPRPGDIITVYWSASPTGSEIVDSKTLELADIGQPIMLTFAGQTIRDQGDGVRYASYRIHDRSGNADARALAVQLQVAAQPVPRVLPPPRVTEASGSANGSTLDLSRAINGATVVIAPEAVIHPGEQVFVQWAEPGSAGAYRTDVPTAPGSHEYRVPNTRIAQHFGTAMPVYYEVFESGVEVPHGSRRHTLTVPRLTGLPVVQCDKLLNGQISLGSIANGGHASFSLSRWSYMATDQFVNLEVRGKDNNGQSVTIEVLKRYSVPQVTDHIALGRIVKTDLQRFVINGFLDIGIQVSFDGALTWVDFPSPSAVRLVN